MKRAVVWVLLLAGAVAAGDDEIAAWVEKLGTSEQAHAFEAMQGGCFGSREVLA